LAKDIDNNSAAWIGLAVSIAGMLFAWLARELANAVFDIADCALRRLDEDESEIGTPLD
jgi:hypothetical protein